MTEQILAALKQLGIEIYHIDETESESVECFFIKKELDLKRKTDVTEFRVTVYREFEKDGVRMLGSSAVQIHPGMEAEEMRDALRGAYRAAALVCNPYYELPAGRKEEFKPSDSGFAQRSLEENMRRMTEALFAEDRGKDVFLNSAEVFMRRQKRHIMNSSGVDVCFEVCDVWGEYVVQCVAPQDVETYHQFSYRDAETEALREEVKEALEMTKARAQAYRAPKAGEYTVLLSGRHLKTIFSYYLERSDAAMIYQKYSDYQTGCAVQGENVERDALSILLKATDPYSREGIPMKDRVLVENGKLVSLHGGARFSYYLGIEPTGEYSRISVPVGDTPLAELKAGPYLHVISFSDFQMDEFTGHFGGEIRLAFLYDGESVTPVTGGSINGSLAGVQGRMTFSRERYSNAGYDGPFAVRLEGVSVAGE